MDLKQLRYFVAIVEEGSLSRAASCIGVAQPSLTQHIKNLEDRLGVELLVRSSKGVTVTEAGQTLLTHAKAIMTSVEQATESVRLAGTEPYGKVSFGLPSSVSMVLSVPLAERVRQDLPKVNLRAVEAMSGFIRDWLHDQSIDLGILYDVAALRNMQTRLLMTEDLHFYAPQNHWPLKTAPGEPVSLTALASIELVLPSSNHGLRALIERFCRTHGVQLNVVIEMDSLTQIKMLVSRGSVSTILAPASAQDFVDKKELSSAPITDPTITRPVYLVRNPARVSTRADREVENMAVEVIKQLVLDGVWTARLVDSDEVTKKGCQ